MTDTKSVIFFIKLYLDFFAVVFFDLLALISTDFLDEVEDLADVAGFKMIDFAILKLDGLTSFFFGIKTFSEDEAFLGAFILNESCEAN